MSCEGKAFYFLGVKKLFSVSRLSKATGKYLFNEVLMERVYKYKILFTKPENSKGSSGMPQKQDSLMANR